MKASGADGALVIGADCVIREGVTINAGTPAGGGETRIGDGCAFLAHAHVGHDCRLGDGVVLPIRCCSAAMCASAIMRRSAAPASCIRMCASALTPMSAGSPGLEGDLVPFGLAGGNRAHLFGLNLVGLKRRGFAEERLARLRAAFRLLFSDEAPEQGVLAERIERAARDFSGDADVAAVLAFLRAERERPLCAPRRRG